MGDVASVIGTVAAVITLVLVIRQELRNRHQRAPVAWSFNVLTQTGGTPEDPVLRVELQNTGREPATVTTLILNGARSVNLTAGLTGRFAPNQPVHLTLDSDDWAGVWILIAWASDHDQRDFRVLWLPLGSTGPLADERRRQWDAEDSRWRKFMGKNRKDQPVGPGGISYRRLSRRQQRQLQTRTNLWSAAATGSAIMLIPLQRK